MTALDLDAASRVLEIPTTPFESVAFGDVSLAPSSPPHIVSQTPSGVPAIPRNSHYEVGAQYLEGQGSMPILAQNHVTFIALNGSPGQSGSWTVVSLGYCDLELRGNAITRWSFISRSPIGGVDIPLPTPLTDGISIYALGQNSSGRYIATLDDGVIWSDDQTPTPPSTWTPGIGTIWGENIDPAVLGVWVFDDVDTSHADAVDTIAAILATFPSDPKIGGFSAVGGQGVGGEAHPRPVLDVIEEPPVTHARPPGGTQEPPPIPPLVIPDDVPDPVLRHVWETLDSPTSFDDRGNPVDWVPTASGNTDYGRLQILAEGEDVTWVDGVPTPLPRWRRVQPFGSFGSAINFPSISTFSPRPAWAKHGANIVLQIVKIGGGTTRLFSGVVAKVGRKEDDGTLLLTCHGAMFVSDLQVRPQRFYDVPLDIGQEIATVLNGAVNRRHNKITPVVTGEKTSVTGSGEPLLTGYVQRLLSTAITGGRQWTVDCPDRTPIIRQKDLTTEAWSVHAGQRGVIIDLEDDAAESPNRYYGSGVNLDGGAWRGMLFPNWKPDDTPPFPNNNASNSFTRGARDSDTDTGNGVSLLEERLGLPVDGYLSTSDWQAIIRFQRQSGIPDDGWVGGQTWATAFKTGENTGTLDGAWRAPLAYAPEVMPFLFGPDGANLGPNPAHDPNVVVVDRDISFGAGVSKQTGTSQCEKLLKRDSGPGWAGSITFAVDLPDRHRFELREGENGRIKDWDGPGNDIVVHVGSVDVDPESGTSTLDVDTRARDYPELSSILERRKNAEDPARTIQRRLTSATLGNSRPTFDAESPAGRLPRHAVFGGFWDIRPMPLGDHGSVTHTSMRTSGPATTFCVGVFAKPITPNQLSSIIGNPLNVEGESPWQIHNDELRERGLIMAWGSGAQPLGYDPRQFHTPAGETGAPITGRFLDDSPWEYYSLQVPWVWVATITSTACYLEGRFRGMPGDW